MLKPLSSRTGLSFEYRTLLLLVYLLVFSYSLTTSAESMSAHAGHSVTLSDEQGDYPLGLHLEILEDPSKELTIQDIRNGSYDNQFSPSNKLSPSFGFNPSAYWVRVNIHRETLR